jgi:hypothetical protein
MWLTRNRRDLMPPLTPSQQFVFDQGEEVGKLAQQLYLCGIDARPASPTNYQPALELTQQLIAEGRQVIYEAAFQFDGVLSALDILSKERGWLLWLRNKVNNKYSRHKHH